MATAAASHRLASLLRSNLVRAAVQPRGSHVAIHETRSRCMKWNSSFAPRHGKAVEPVIIEETTQEEKAQPKDKTQSEDSLRPEDKTKLENKTRAPGEQEQEQPTSTKHNAEASRTKSIVKCENQGPAEEAHENEPSRKTSDDSADESTGASSSSTRPLDEPTQQIKDKAKANGPLEAIMHMQPPQKAKGQHPHMSPSPYVHHFDSYTLVKHLQDGGYTQNQAIEAMKGIRALLAQNLDVAQESLVSKSDVENETYLFSAACSELGQEIKNNRRLQDEQERQQRTHLQHEVDILTQSLNQEVLTLNDNVRGMFNDRRMTVREEQKNADSSIQQINYKISTSLVSNCMSEIEGVRWILIRRSALGIFFMAMLTLATVRYATYLSHKRKREVEREKEEREELRRDGGKRDNSSSADAAAILAAN